MAALLLLALLAVLNGAEAEPLPAAYSGSTHGDVMNLDMTAAGVTLGAALAHSATDVDSTGTPRAHAESANLEAGAAGIPIGVASGEADSDNTTRTDSYNTGLGQVDASPLLDTGVVTGTGQTNWAGDGACVPDGTPIAQSTTSLAGAQIGIPGVNVMNLGAVQTSGQTTLESGSVVSTSSGNLASLSLINNLVGIQVLDQPTLTATSDGTTGSISANDYGVRVTAPGVDTTLRAGGSVPVTVSIPGVATANLTISVGALDDTSSGATGSGTMTFLRIQGSLTGPFGVNLASLDFGLLPLSASATGAPDGGVQCDQLNPPAITSPTSGDTTGETPTISGTGTPGALVTVTEGGTTVGTAVVGDDGTWSFTPDTPLSLGDHTITASQTLGDAASGPSDPTGFTVADQTPPAAPVIGTPVDGSVTGDNTPTISGTAEPGSTVRVTDQDGNALGTVVTGADGTWTLDAPALDDGGYTITATATDAAGNTSPASDTVAFTVDTTAPAAPVVTGPADGSTVGTGSPAITGTGAPGSTVEVTVDGQVAGTTTVDDDGNWSFTPPTALDDGDHTVTATQTDPAGNTSPASEPVTFTVDTTAPDAPAITGPADGTVTRDSTPVISGTAEAGAKVEVTDDSGTVLGSATADAAGNWSFTSADLADGRYTITATATDAAGNISEPSGPVTFTVDTAAPDAPVITGPADGSTTGDSTPTITGTGEPGAEVQVTVDGAVAGTATVDAGGQWSFDLTDPLSDGGHTVSATQTDAAGNVSPAASNDFTVDTTAAPPVIQTPANGTVTTNTTPTVSGTGEPGATVTVTDQNGDELGTAEVGPDGNWSLDSSTLADGTYTITATQVDAQGNTSPASSPVIFTVDTTAPDAPAIQGPADGSTISDSTPTVSGTGEPGAEVEVTVDGTVVGTATVDANGQWSLDLTDPLSDGDHTVSATQTDAAGNVSAAASNGFTVDTTAPDAPAIQSPADGSTIGDSTPTVSGTGEPGAKVEVTVDGSVAGTATVDANGQWSFDLTDPLPDGGHTVSATQTDTAGNVSPAAASNFTVDTAAPAAPVILGPTDGSVTGDTTPAISGTAEPGATVTVTDGNGDTLGTATANADGEWSLDSSALTDGSYTITATATDAAGNTSKESGPVTFTVDTVPPDAPVVTGPQDGSTTADNMPTIRGTGEPGAIVEVTVDGTVVGTATVDADGTWSLGAPQLTDGPHTVTATETDAAGHVSPASDPITFVVDTTAPAAPVTLAPPNDSATADDTPLISGTGVPGATVEVRIDGDVVGTTTVDLTGQWSLGVSDPLPDGTHTVTATQSDEVGNTSVASEHVSITVDTTAKPPVITSPGDGSTTGDRTPTITGTGEPGATVRVSIDGQAIGSATVDPAGNWSLRVADALADGRHTISAIQTDPAGNVSAPRTVTFTVGATAPAPPVITSPHSGDALGDRTPAVSGTGEPGATVLLRANGDGVGTATVGADGTWSVTLAAPLPCGSVTLTATERARGMTSAPSDPVRVTETCGGATTGPGGAPGGNAGTEPGGGLPFTGAPAWLLGLATLAVLATTGGAWLIRRRNG